MMADRMTHRSKRLLALSLSLFVVIASVLVWNYSAVKTEARWLLSSRHYKSDVLSQPSPPGGELRHIAWDGWGWAGQNTTVYLVFDPTDSLSMAAATHESGKFAGIPCDVPKVSRLESQWYVVTFYTSQEWGHCN
jgi:hypothetical protein